MARNITVGGKTPTPLTVYGNVYEYECGTLVNNGKVLNPNGEKFILTVECGTYFENSGRYKGKSS